MFKVVVLQCLIVVADRISLLTCDDKLQIIQKIAKRVHKLSFVNEQRDWVEFIVEKANETLKIIKNGMDSEFFQVVAGSRFDLAKIDTEKINPKDKHHNIVSQISKIEALGQIKQNSSGFNQISSKTIERNFLNAKFPSLTLLDTKDLNNLGLHLYDMENWVKFSLNSYLYNPNPTKLFEFLEKYIKVAIEYYRDDPLGYSRLIMTAIQIVCSLDKIACVEFPMLLDHEIGFTSDILKCLLLPRSTDITYAYEINQYILKRNEISSFPSLIDTNVKEKNSFSHRFFESDQEMNDIKSKILKTAEINSNQKLEEVARLRIKYNEYDTLIATTECYYRDGYYGAYHAKKRCDRCKRRRLKNELGTQVFELPLPAKNILSNIIIFELKIPLSIAVLRDAIYVLYTKILGFDVSESKIKGT